MVKDVIKRDKEYQHVVIIGGGDLIIAAYILKNFENVKKLTVCDIDERVVEVTKRFFSFAEIIDKEIKLGRLEVIIQSGATYM